MKEYKKVEYRDIPLFRDVQPEQWNDWRWQLRNQMAIEVLELEVTSLFKLEAEQKQ